MCCVDLKEQFLSYTDVGFQQSSNWNSSAFMKSCNEALIEVEDLKSKVKELERDLSKHTGRLTGNKTEQQYILSKLANVRDNLKICETHLKRITLMNVDMRTSSSKFAAELKNSIVATLEMKLLQLGMRLKNIYHSRSEAVKPKHNLSITSEQNYENAPNLSRPHFIEQTEEELMEQVAVNEYKDIEKSIVKISQMYKETISVVKIHQFFIDSIENNIDGTEINVEKGRKNLSEAYKRESKNKAFIMKVFFILHITVFVYIVIFS